VFDSVTTIAAGAETAYAVGKISIHPVARRSVGGVNSPEQTREAGYVMVFNGLTENGKGRNGEKMQIGVWRRRPAVGGWTLSPGRNL